MAGATPGMDFATIPRVAAQLSRCFRTGIVPAEVAEPLRSCFPEALLLSVSVPSVGLEDDLLISFGNFLETGFPKVTLAALRTSAAGRCYTSNAQLECPHQARQPGHEARLSDAEMAREGSYAEVLLCSPIPLSTAGVLARSGSSLEASGFQPGCLGTLTLGLRGVSSSMDRYKEDLHRLALLLAETVQRDSRGLVVDVCRYQLGGRGPWPEEEPLSSLDLSTSCSTEGGKYSSSSGGPPDGSLPQLVEDTANSQGPGDESTDQNHREQGDQNGPQQERYNGRGDEGSGHGGKQQRDSASSQHKESQQGSENEPIDKSSVAQTGNAGLQPEANHQGSTAGVTHPGRIKQGDSRHEGNEGRQDHDVLNQKAALATNLARLRMDDSVMRGSSFQDRAQLPDHSSTRQASDGEARADRRADLKTRAGMIDTYDAKAAGCTASAFEQQSREEPSHGPRNGRRPSSDSAGKAANGYSLQSCCRDQNGHSSPGSSGKGQYGSNQQSGRNGDSSPGSSESGLCGTEKQPGACKDDSAAGKPDMQKPKRHSLARMPLMCYKDARMERTYTLWHARHRWQVDAAGFLTMTVLSARFAVAFSEEAEAAWQSAALASCQHVLPLLIMAISLSWYLRNRELVLGTYLVLSAAVTAYSSHRDTLQLESQSALAALVWFSRAHSAEPVMLKSIIFALRFRMVVFVQALCVLVAASRAAHVCSVCCSTFMSPTFCLFKAWATQVVFGCGVPAAVFYFTEDTFRQVFEEQHLQEA